MKSKRRIGGATQVTAAEPGVHKVTNAPGLYLRRSATAGSWIFRYRAGAVQGIKKDGSVGLIEKKREMGLGSAIGPGAVTLADARKKAITHRRQVDDGADPLAVQEQARIEAEAEARREARKVTFVQAANAYVDEYAPGWKHRHARANWHNPVKRYVYPVIGDMLLDDIKVADVRKALDAAKNVPGIANRLRQYIGLVLDDAAEKGLRDEDLPNPADARRHRSLKRRAVERKHYLRLDLDAAPAAFCRIQELAAGSTAPAAWMFMIATAVRPSEALEAHWDEIDFDKKLWRIPPARTKANREHAVPLSSLALVILKRQSDVRVSDAIFPGQSGKPLSYSAFAKAPVWASVNTGSPHSWRSMFRDACGDRLRVDRDLAEAALSHSLGAVEGAYRRETAIEARRPVMEAYARWLLGEGANVVSFPAPA
jgi:integrase